MYLQTLSGRTGNLIYQGPQNLFISVDYIQTCDNNIRACCDFLRVYPFCDNWFEWPCF